MNLKLKPALVSPSHTLNLSHCAAHMKVPGPMEIHKEPCFEVVEEVNSTGITKVFKVRVPPPLRSEKS